MISFWQFIGTSVVMAACNTFGGSVQREGRQLLTLNFEAFGWLEKDYYQFYLALLCKTKIG